MEHFTGWSFCAIFALRFSHVINSNQSIQGSQHNSISRENEFPLKLGIDFEDAVQGNTFYSINSSTSLGDFYRSFSTVNCQNIICLAGGVCSVTEDSSSKCLCQMGTTGKYCEQEVNVKYPKFHGSGYIVFPVLRKAERSFVIKIEFKPESESGVLLFTADQPDAKFDFFSISLVFSRVEFRYDCGSGMAVIKSSNFVYIDKWNQVTVSRNEWHGWLQLNNETQTRGKSKGKFSRINFQNDLYLGGHHNLSEISERAGTNLGFHGCVRSMQINEKFYDMRKGAFVGDAIRGMDVDECSAGVCGDLNCMNGGQCIAENAEVPVCVCPLGTAGNRCQRKIKLLVPMFSGSSFLQYVGLQRNVLSYTEIEIHFKPVHNYGLIFYNGYAKDRTGDFLSLALNDGFVEFRFDLGTGAALLRSQHRLTSNEWHVARLSRTGRSGFLKVDDQQLVEGMASGAFTQLTLTLDLYLGGHRNFDEVATAANVNRAFQGCIQKVVINNRPMKLIDEAITGSNVRNCDHQCVEQPCQHNGRCIPNRDSYFCSCMLGFVGDYCDTALKIGSESTASFNKNSFLLFLNPSIVQRTSGREFRIQFSMKAKSSNGLIFWVSEEENGPHGDYLSVGLRDGFLQMSFNLGSGDVNILFNHTKVDDGAWHVVHAYRRGKVGEMQIDGRNVTRGMSPGDMTQLTSPGSIFIGGMEDLVHGTLQQFKEGFSGCLGNFSLGDDRRLEMMADAVEGANVVPCL